MRRAVVLFGYPAPPMAAEQTTRRTRLEPLALASLLTAIVLGWCPLTAVAAIVLGLVAIHRVRSSDGLRSGQGLAIAGVAVGTTILVLEGWLLGALQSEVQDSMDTQTIAAVESACTVMPAQEAEWDTRSSAPEAAERARFAREVADAVGAIRQVTVTHRTAEGLAEPVISAAFNAAGERGTVFGTASFSTQPGTLPPVLLLRSIEVEVAGRRLRLPASDAGEAKQPERAPAETNAP